MRTNNRERRVPRAGLAMTTGIVMVVLTVLGSRSDMAGQGRSQGAGSAGQPPASNELAPTDLFGTWVSVVSEDWRWRMVTPPARDAASVPLSDEGRKTLDRWSLDADRTGGNQCRAFGVGGIMRQPGRIRISLANATTLRLEFDAGTQTRLLHFDRSAPPPAERTWQGHSIVQRQGLVVSRGDAPPGSGAPPPFPGVDVGSREGRPRVIREHGGTLRVQTTHFREGYLRKNGVPYSEEASVTEYYTVLPPHPNGDVWLHVLTVIDDPRYLREPFYTSAHFMRESDATKWSPTPCRTDPPLDRPAVVPRA